LKDKLGVLAFCLAFALPFGGVGAGAAYVIYHTVKDGIRAQDWVRVKADLQGFGPGTISYQYMVDGKRYHGDRLGTNILGGTDDIDDFHDRVREHLSAAQSENKPITVWVNPDAPSESMFDRDIRWKLMLFASVFALAFGGVGVGAIAFAIASLLPKKAVDKVKNSQVSGVGTIWVFAFFWNVISMPIAILALPEMLAEGNWIGLLILIFPLIGVLLLWGAIQATWQLFRRGGANLVLESGQATMGEAFAGHVAFGRKVKAGENFRVRLEAVKESGSSDERAAWSKEIQARVTDAGGGPRLAFRFETPKQVPTAGDSALQWRLDVISSTRAADVHYKFPVAIAEPEEEEEGEQAPAFAMVDEPMPVALGPGFEKVEEMLSGAGVKLTSKQMEFVRQVSPENREKVAKLVSMGPALRKIVWWGVVIFIVLQFVPGIIMLLSGD
jgi:hypothetical protein